MNVSRTAFLRKSSQLSWRQLLHRDARHIVRQHRSVTHDACRAGSVASRTTPTRRHDVTYLRHRLDDPRVAIPNRDQRLRESATTRIAVQQEHASVLTRAAGRLSVFAILKLACLGNTWT